MQVSTPPPPTQRRGGPAPGARGEPVPPAGGPTVPATREITIADLLTHTSGIAQGAAERNPDDTLASLVPRYA
ncbi:MAG TPA: hypothetical protein VFZ73_19850, partial [Gemmatimonadaceae bacterium]